MVREICRPQHAPAHKTGGSKKAVLVADDEPELMSEFYRTCFEVDPELSQYDLFIVDNSAGGLRLFRENQGRIMAVVSDRNMHKNKTAGDQFIRDVRAIEQESGTANSSSRGVGIAMLSGTLPKEEERSLIPADKFECKPIRMDTLAALLKEMIQLTEKRQQQRLTH